MNQNEYVESLLPEDRVLNEVKEEIRQEGMPEISIAAGYGKLLTILVKMVGAKKVLEIGALGGYSGICLARGLGAGGKLISLELNPDFAEVAKRNLTRAGLGDKVEYRVGDASDSLEQLVADGEQFDLVFIDADKGGYPHYFEQVMLMTRPGAVIVGDNSFMYGKTYDQTTDSSSVRAMRSFNKSMSSDPRLEGVVLPAYDGLAVARVK